MVFFPVSTPAPFATPAGAVEERGVYTGTACLALMDSAVTAQVWEDLLYDGVDHDHAAGGLMVNSAAVGTHLEHDGDFPVEVTTDDVGRVVGLRVNLDPYAEDLADVRNLDGHAHSHDRAHSHAGGPTHSHDHDHGHEAGHVDGWSTITRVQLVSDRAVFGDPAGLPEADDTGDLLDLTFPSPGGVLSWAVFTSDGLRREARAVWAPA